MSQSRSPADGTTSSTKWYELYQAAMRELDDSKLPLRIVEARHAIYDRAEQILTVSTTDEHRDLNNALRILSALEKLAAKGKRAA